MAAANSNTDKPTLRRIWGRYVVVQVISIFCIVHAAGLFVIGVTRIELGATTAHYTPHMLLLAALFLGLHWRFQGQAYQLDPVRSGQIYTLITGRNSSSNPDY